MFTSCYLALLLSQLGKTLMQDNGNKLYANQYFSPGMWLARLHPSISGHVLAVFRQFFCAEAENKQSPESGCLRVLHLNTHYYGLLTSTD